MKLGEWAMEKIWEQFGEGKSMIRVYCMKFFFS